MQRLDVAKLRLANREIQKYLDSAAGLAADNDATRAFAAAEEARKRLQEVYAALYYEHLVTGRRA